MVANKLTFVYHTPFWIERGRIVTSHAAVGRYVDALAPYFSEITLAVPSPGKNDTRQYSLKSTNFKLLQLPHYHNIQGFWLQAPLILYKLMRSAASWGILNVRAPTHLGSLAFLAAKFWKKKTFFVVVGEFYPYNSLSNYSYLKQKIVNVDSIIQDKLMAFMYKRSLLFTNGEQLFQKYHHDNNSVFLTRSSTIDCEDININKEPRLHNPILILTVAVISPSKGTVLIPEIIYHLKKMGCTVEWHYVGRPDGAAGEQELQRTQVRASELVVSEQLIFHGHKPWYELKHDYHDADLFVLPTYVEGIPRVLLEAQAAGLPIVTTKVGGIPQAVRNWYDGILVPPGDALIMAQTIGEVVRNKKLYCRLMGNGFETAKDLSLESETKRMLQRVGKEFDLVLQI